MIGRDDGVEGGGDEVATHGRFLLRTIGVFATGKNRWFFYVADHGEAVISFVLNDTFFFGIEHRMTPSG